MHASDAIRLETRPRLLGEFDLQLRPAACYGARPEFGACLRVYGRQTPYFPGTREMPDEPPGYDIERVTLSLGGHEATIEPDQALSDWIDAQLEDA